jgi:hypothetical protein
MSNLTHYLLMYTRLDDACDAAQDDAPEWALDLALARGDASAPLMLNLWIGGLS